MTSGLTCVLGRRRLSLDTSHVLDEVVSGAMTSAKRHRARAHILLGYSGQNTGVSVDSTFSAESDHFAQESEGLGVRVLLGLKLKRLRIRCLRLIF